MSSRDRENDGWGSKRREMKWVKVVEIGDSQALLRSAVSQSWNRNGLLNRTRQVKTVPPRDEPSLILTSLLWFGMRLWSRSKCYWG